MKTTLTLAAGALLAGGFLSASPGAMAAPCPTTQTLTAWAATPTCENGDKQYTYLSKSASLPGGSDFKPTFFTLFGEEIHNANIVPANALLQGVYTLSYTIEITDPLKWFKNVSIDADVPAQAPGVTFQKVLDDDANTGNGTIGTLTSIGGNPSAIFALAANTFKKLWIYETVTVAANGAVNSFTDTYTQTTRQVPEPGSLALLGLGLAGLAAARRRRK